MADGLIYSENCMDVMDCMGEEVDLTLTSPPYDSMRKYSGYEFDARAVIRKLLDVTKPGGACVWVVGDKVENGAVTLTSFKQGLMFQEAGWTVTDVMAYHKRNAFFKRPGAYVKAFEYMFVCSKGRPKTFNPLVVPCKRAGHTRTTPTTSRRPDGGMRIKPPHTTKPTKMRTNVWSYSSGFGNTTRDRYAYDHPAMFPEKLAEDHIRSWSNPGDLVFDPMCGSGTTLKMAKLLGRRWTGCDVSARYAEIARRRTAEACQKKLL